MSLKKHPNDPFPRSFDEWVTVFGFVIVILGILFVLKEFLV